MILLFLFLCSLSHAAIVNLTYGQIEGAELKYRDHTVYHAFKKVPYAKPPLGKLRFAVPEKPLPWNGIWNASVYGPACMSNSSVTSSPQKWVDENCLHLNFFVSEKCLHNGGCPVVFYIHGGDVFYDSAVMFNDTKLYETFVSEDIVLVIVGYRLGIFSHLTFATQEVAKYNIALYDLIRGLEFIHSEVDKFGGDPAKVTIFGHSFGGELVHLLAYSQNIDPEGKLFYKAVAMSASAEFEIKTEQIDVTMEFAKRSKCYPTGINESDTVHDNYILECLQKLDQFELLRIQRAIEEEGIFTLPSGVLNERPLLTGDENIFKNPKKIPYLLGTTLHELDMSLTHLNMSQLLGYRNYHELDTKFQKDFKEGYFGETSEETIAFFVVAKLIANTQYSTGAPVYLYSFREPAKSFHTDDLSYLFGIHAFEQNTNQKVLAKLYPKYFTNFIKFGIPSPDWPPFNPILDTFYNVNVDLKKKIAPHADIKYEHKTVKYWFEDMKKLDNLITARKTISQKANLIELTPIPEEDYFYLTFTFAIVIFFIGICLGRYVFTRRQDVIVQIIDERTPLFPYEKNAERIF